MGIGERLIFHHLVVQDGEVVGGDIVGVVLVDGFRKRPAFVIPAQPQQILGELPACRFIFRLEFQRALLRRRALGEPIFFRQLASDEMIHRRV